MITKTQNKTEKEKHKGFIIKKSKVENDFYAYSNNTNKTFVGSSIKDIKNKIDKMKSKKGKRPSKVFPELNKAIKELKY